MKKHLTIPKLAKLLGVSRIAVYKRVKKGQIKAARVGRTYVITEPEIDRILGEKAEKRSRQKIDIAVKKTVREYGDVLKKLGKE